MSFLPKIAIAVFAAVSLTACMQAEPPIPRDDPRWAQADARYEGTVYGTSGIAGLAYVGASRQGLRVSILYDQTYSTPAEVAAAPAKICAAQNATVASSTNMKPQSELWGPNTLELLVMCSG